MPTVSLTKQYKDAAKLNEEKLDALFDSVETAINVIKLDSTNIKSNELTTDAFDEAQTISYPLAFSGSKVTIVNGGIQTEHLADGAVTSSRVQDYTIKTDRRADYSSLTFVSPHTVSTTLGTDVNALFYGVEQSISANGWYVIKSISYTSVGRPVIIMPVISGQQRRGFLFNSSDATAQRSMSFLIRRDSTCVLSIATRSVAQGEDGDCQSLPFTEVVDFPPAGTHTYVIKIFATTSSLANIFDADLIFREL